MIKRITNAGMAVIMSAVMLLSGSAGSLTYAAAQDESYEFDHARTAVAQLEELFTTIDIMDATVASLSDEMEKGNVTSEQLVQMYIDRIQAYDKKKKLNSIISINPKALEEARALDEERAAGTVRGPLHGIPIVVKDNYDVAGTATTGGSLALADFISEKDAFTVQKLKAAGVIVIAKANLSEFASSAWDSHSLIGGNTHNPYDVTRSPTGSSGGTAAAVAANFATIGFGTDTGGSIRNPSSWCNLYGIRPSKGLTSIDGIIPLTTYKDTAGPMARTAEDMALALETMAGTDPNDDYTQEADADGLVQDGYTQYLSPDGLKGKRIGYLESSFINKKIIGKNDDGTNKYEVKEPDPKVSQIIRRTRADFKKAGATLVDMSDVLSDEVLDDAFLDFFWFSFSNTIEYDMNRYLYGHGDNAPYKTLKELVSTGKYGIDFMNLSDDPEDIEEYADSFEETKNPYTLEINGYQRYKVWDKTLPGRVAFVDVMEQKNVDAIIFLVNTDVAVHDHEDYFDTWQQVNPGVNTMSSQNASLFGVFYGCPDMVIPMGFSETDETCPNPMPLGMHVVGKFGDEKSLMQIAYAYEQQAGPDIRQMPATTPALKDVNLNAYLEALMDEVYSIDYAAFGSKPDGKVRLMEAAYDRASAVDRSDPYAVYDAAYDLAKAYDKTVAALKASGLNLAKAELTLSKSRYAYTGKKRTPAVDVKVGGVTLVQNQDYNVAYRNNLNVGTASVLITPAGAGYAGSKTAHFTIVKGKTTFKVKVSKKKIKATNLSRGSSKVRFSVKKVTNGQMSKVKINSRTGKLTLKKGIKKCTIYVKATSKANKNRKAKAKTIKTAVR